MSTAYTTEKTWATGDDATAALFNTHIRDNSQFLHQPPCCRVFNSANISVPNAANTALTFNSERYDTDTMHSTAVNTGRLVASTAGKYHLSGHVQFAANATGIRANNIRLNGTTYIAAHGPQPGNSAFGADIPVACDYSMAAADYVELMPYQNSGGALNVSAVGNISPEFSAHWFAA